MAYDTAELYNRALEAVEKYKLFFIEDVVNYLAISKPTFYDHFKVNSNELNAIKTALNVNRIKIKVNIRKQWSESGNPVSQMALYKLIGSEDERRRLSMTQVDVKVRTDDSPEIDLGRLTKEERAQFYALYEKARIPVDGGTIDIDYEDVNPKQLPQ